ncbi:hypothetical protein ACP4OV_016671 [Aristida adscensionis]
MASSTSAANNDVAAAKDAAAAEKEQQPEGTVRKTVQTVEVRSSAGQDAGEGVLKPVRVVHHIPAKDANHADVVKQD